MTKSDNTKAAAKIMLQKLEATSANLGIFILGGVPKATRTTTSLFKETLRLHPGRLMGVYNATIHPDHLADDLHHMGVR